MSNATANRKVITMKDFFRIFNLEKSSEKKGQGKVFPFHHSFLYFHSIPLFCYTIDKKWYQGEDELELIDPWIDSNCPRNN